MWHIRKPTAACIRAFIASQSQQAFSYAEVGCSRAGAPAGYDLDHNRIALGQGPALFEAASTAIQRWAMFPSPWTEIHPANAPIAPGTTVALLARAVGLWWLNACRIVYVFDESSPIRRFGFAYGTLPGHVERGEERFSVELLADGAVWYDIRAVSRPRYWMTRLAYPLARRLQRRFVLQSQAQMAALGT